MPGPELCSHSPTDPLRAYGMNSEIMHQNSAYSAGILNQAADKLAEESLSNASIEGESRLDKFVNTIKGFANGGVGVGMRTGQVVTFIPDLVTGDGIKDNGEIYDPKSEGVLGMATHFAADGAATVGALPGAIIGGAVGTVMSPALPNKTMYSPEYDTHVDLSDAGSFIAHSTRTGADAGGRTAGWLVSVPGSIAVNVARAPSVIVKYALAGVGGLVGAITGFFVGAFRAAINE